MSPSSPSRVSVSTVSAMVSVTETHLFKIEGYNRLRDMHGTGRCLESSRFQAGGHAWRIRCYPNGDAAANAACVSLYLQIADGQAVPAKDVRAEVTFSLVRHPGAPASLLPPCRGSFAFTYNKVEATTRSRGFPRFINREEIDWFSGYMRDECVAVRCDVTVVEKTPAKEEEEVVQARDEEMLGLACDCKDELCKRHHATTGGLGFRQAFAKLFLRCF
ncbi:hypothetical protein HU200_051332 [Digitaria exilis]|uniref:MATH domain-containing protein n=1 Tax=Digitaria exilis TaxID=1010633 RepID=A0A835AT76_9POAL|nr:hypothetical protein HU200_051332 [Digitaria exilis]